VQEVKPNDKQLQCDFCAGMLNWLEKDNSLLDRIVFSDEAKFYLSDKVNRHNLIMWGSENTYQVLQHVYDSQKVNVFCACQPNTGP
jgi:hypothetical protein